MQAQEQEIKINNAKEALEELEVWHKLPQTQELLEFLTNEAKSLIPLILEPAESEHHREIQQHQKGEVRGLLQLASAIKQKENDLRLVIANKGESKEKPTNPIQELLDEGYNLLNLT